jgi:hypothetical protein
VRLALALSGESSRMYARRDFEHEQRSEPRCRYLTESSSMSKRSVALGGITGGEPGAP